MKTSGAVTKILALVCLIQLATARRTFRNFNDLIVKTNAYGIDKSEAFFDIPTVTSSPLFQDYVKVEPEAGFKFHMNFYCHKSDPRVCFMYDKKGHVAGIQISMLKEDVNKIDSKHYDYAGNPNYIQTNFFNTPAYSVRVYFTNPEKLTAAGRKDPTGSAEGLWTYLDGQLVEVQLAQPSGSKMGDFDKQGCYPAMGQHYMYKYNKDSTCKEIFNIFPLYEKGGLVGFGLSLPGTASKGPHRAWFETPTPSVIKQVITNAPTCHGSSHGYSTLHVFLVSKPWNIGCP